MGVSACIPLSAPECLGCKEKESGKSKGVMTNEISMPIKMLLLRAEKLLLLPQGKILCNHSYDKSQFVVVIILTWG